MSKKFYCRPSLLPQVDAGMMSLDIPGCPSPTQSVGGNAKKSWDRMEDGHVALGKPKADHELVQQADWPWREAIWSHLRIFCAEDLAFPLDFFSFLFFFFSFLDFPFISCWKKRNGRDKKVRWNGSPKRRFCCQGERNQGQCGPGTWFDRAWLQETFLFFLEGPPELLRGWRDDSDPRRILERLPTWSPWIPQAAPLPHRSSHL